MHRLEFMLRRIGTSLFVLVGVTLITFALARVVPSNCLLYTSDAADDLLCVDLGGRRIIKKKKNHKTPTAKINQTYTEANNTTNSTRNTTRINSTTTVKTQQS